MTTKKAKAKEDAPEENGPEAKSLDELILNYLPSKYTAIPLASMWAKELRRHEDNRHLTATEILEMALADVLAGKVDWKDAKKWAANGKAEAPAEEKKGR